MDGYKRMNTFSWPEQPGSSAFPIAKPGIPFIAAAAAATLVLAIAGFSFLALLSLGVTLFICFFFRDPDRVVSDQPGAISSPADGKVVFAGRVDENPYISGPCTKISIFMSVFNVHVNRIPLDGVVSEIRYFPGKFINASLDKSSIHNERNAVLIDADQGFRYATVQIAGLIARRIICGIKKGDTASRGARFGLICFGSRLDVYLPTDIEIAVSLGDKVQAGTSIIGYHSHG